MKPHTTSSQGNSSPIIDAPGLTFGTAGLRAPVGSGPDKINVSTITRATAGVADWLIAQQPHRPDGAHPLTVAVSCDARYGSRSFAEATAEVFAAKGFAVTFLDGFTPTPVLAWIVKDRNLTAGVQITASHNPKGDNGYKLYLAGGSQLVSPADAQIEACIKAQPPAELIPRSRNVRVDHGAAQGYETAVSTTVASCASDVLHSRRTLKIAYTAMHGVGGDTFESLMRANGFSDLHAVAAQRWPDPEFPTVAFPNPEELGATDLLIRLGQEIGADLLIALDPDADRCMVGVPTGNADAVGQPEFRMLSGNEAGPLLASHLVRTRDEAPVVATTVASSQLLKAMAAHRGWDYVETPTGFKYLARAADGRPGELAFAYEEAIGTCPAPRLVADKDGLATGLIMAAWVADLQREGSSLLEQWQLLEDTYGVYRTGQVSVRVETVAGAGGVIKKFVNNPPHELAGAPVRADVLGGAATVLLTGTTDEGVDVRVVARASGTEPKAKFYVQAHCGPGQVDGAALAEAVIDQLQVDIPRAVEAIAGIA